MWTMADTQQRHLVEGEAGLHRDGEKPRLADYLDWSLVIEAGQIAAANCRKTDDYPDGKYPDLPGGVSNFKGGIRASKLLDSAMRHLIAVIMGEDLDPESGKRHLAHLICNISMIGWTLKHRPDLDDRCRLPETAKRPEASGAPTAIVNDKHRTVCPFCGIGACFIGLLPGETQRHVCAHCGYEYTAWRPDYE